jgi:hypothetical protein
MLTEEWYCRRCREAWSVGVPSTEDALAAQARQETWRAVAVEIGWQTGVDAEAYLEVVSEQITKNQPVKQ